MMQLIGGPDNIGNMVRMYHAVANGYPQSARGTESRNQRDLAIVLHTDQEYMLTSFAARKLNLKYARMEWLWYLEGNKFADWICNYSTMWVKLQQKDGSFYSNYGQYIFHHPDDIMKSQFMYVIQTLLSDPSSRRASIVLLKPEHLYPENTDVVCTYAINFTIEDGRLHMTVMMRSNDVIFGFTNDSFCFWQLYQFVYAKLRQEMPFLLRGQYTHFANSMHVYARHYDMIHDLVMDGAAGYEHIEVPVPTVDDVDLLINNMSSAHGTPYIEWLKAE